MTTCGSCPNVCAWRAHRGSVARSSVGCSAARIPTATYSCRAMSAKRRTRSASRSAASPSGSGHCENALAANDVPAFSMNACRGSVEMVTGIPCGVSRGEPLHGVVPAGRQPRVVQVVHVEVVDELALHHLARGGLADPAGTLEHRPVRTGLDHRVEHQADLLLQRQAGQQVVDPLLRRQVGVAVRLGPRRRAHGGPSPPLGGGCWSEVQAVPAANSSMPMTGRRTFSTWRVENALRITSLAITLPIAPITIAWSSER